MLQKLSPDLDIPSKIIKDNVKIFTDCLHSILIIQFISLNFHKSLNCQISLLPLRKETEVLKKIINQSAHFQTSQKLLNDACFVKLSVLGITILQSNNLGVRKRYNIQCCLLVMLEKWKNAVDKRKHFGGSISDLSETLFLTNC